MIQQTLFGRSHPNNFLVYLEIAKNYRGRVGENEAFILNIEGPGILRLFEKACVSPVRHGLPSMNDQ